MKRWGRFVLCGMALLQGCVTTPPPPTPSEAAHAQAKEAYLLNDYQRTLAIVEPLAIAGEPWAQYTLGYMYHYGRGVAVDRQMAKQWISRAAEQGYVPAQEAMKRLSTPAPQMEEDIDSTPKAQPSSNKNSTAPPSTSPQTTVPSPTPTVNPPLTSSSLNASAAEEHNEASAPQTAPAASMSEPTPQAMAASEPPQEPSPMSAPKTVMPPPASPPASAATQTNAPSPPPAKATARNTSPPAHNDGIKGNDWIMSQDPQYYTLQLIGSSNEAAVIRFIHKNGIEKEAAYYSVTRKGQAWYAVVYGSFRSRDIAHQSLQHLPATLHHASPWIRSFHDIRAAIAP